MRYAAVLDALISLTLVSGSPGYCWPSITAPMKDGEYCLKPALKIDSGRHPMLEICLEERYAISCHDML